MGKGKNALLPKQKRIRINNEGKPASVHADLSFEFLNHYGIIVPRSNGVAARKELLNHVL